jgi:hypothetical protein
MRVAVLTLALAAAPVAFAQDPDAAALDLADKTAEAKPQQGGDWRVFAEAAARSVRLRNPDASTHDARYSFDARFDKAFAPGWRAVLADRLDLQRPEGGGDRDVNTLKEAYLSWQPAPDRIADLGRVNVRNGVALGYNPTDYFRAGAVRSVVSLDPASLRENRLGTDLVRGQALWAGGSLSALYAPKLGDAPSAADYSADFGASNPRDRWLLALGQKLGGLSPQWLLQGGDGQSAQLGFNLTGLANDATVAYFEWSGGRSESLAAQAGIAPPDEAFRSRAAAGVTYTTPQNLSLSFEVQYNGAGLDRAGWDALRRGSPAAYGAYRRFAANQQDPPTRYNLFFYALWQDAMVKHLDLAAMVRYDAIDYSRLQWLEARYHWAKVDAALQLQVNSGEPGSDYGALPERRVVQALLRYFF